MEFENISKYLNELSGKVCCRKRVGYGKSLSLGFGDKIFHSNPRKVDSYYGEWEIGSYDASWRILKSGSIILGSSDPVDHPNELDIKLQEIEFGNFDKLMKLSDMDVRLALSNDILIDFLTDFSEDDEAFHVFFPDKKYIEFKVSRGWIIGESNQPWNSAHNL